jgi:hypothetical protein
MRFVAEPISDLRLQRFHRWALLWLSWFAAFLDAAGALGPLAKQAETIGHRWLDRIERVLVAIVMLRAIVRVRPLRDHRAHAQHRIIQHALSRAVIGAKLRRALRCKHLRQRCEALRHADLGAFVTHILRRLPRGLTRRRPILTLPKDSGAYPLSADVALTLSLNSS